MLILPLIAAANPVAAKETSSLNKVPCLALNYIGSEKASLTRLSVLVTARLSPFIQKITGITNASITERISLDVLRDLFSTRGALTRQERLTKEALGRAIARQILAHIDEVPPSEKKAFLEKVYLSEFSTS